MKQAKRSNDGANLWVSTKERNNQLFFGGTASCEASRFSQNAKAKSTMMAAAIKQGNSQNCFHWAIVLLSKSAGACTLSADSILPKDCQKLNDSAGGMAAVRASALVTVEPNFAPATL